MLIWAAVVAYFLPTIIAGMRLHHQGGAIFALNLLLGWTLIGWVAAFVWSCTAINKQLQTPQVKRSGLFLTRDEVRAEERKQRQEAELWSRLASEPAPPSRERQLLGLEPEPKGRGDLQRRINAA